MWMWCRRSVRAQCGYGVFVCVCVVWVLCYGVVWARCVGFIGQGMGNSVDAEFVTFGL